ncbi:hypothetical protein J1N35_001454 [Gossypium stocksii]|uniref:Uncharacterized protein n=1 Tax=Gossypium stocksii TaxID=47602 RepID=A0A9D3WJD0_9ROSI|nr:hypothetical protein J1N35_001454 [Gossypium stocksii]
MSERISVVIYYDGEVRHTENGVVFLSENTARLVFNQNIDLIELCKRIKHKIFGTTPMKVLSIKYRFCASVDPVTYDSFDIKGARGLKAMLQHLLLFERSTRPLPDTPLMGGKTQKLRCLAAVRNTQPLHDTPLVDGICTLGTSTSTGWQATSDWGRYETSRRRDDLLPTMSTGEGTSYIAADGRSDDESDVDQPREPRPDGTKVALFSEPEPVPTEPEGGSDEEEEDSRFRAYSPPTHMHNVDLSEDDALEFPDLPHRRRDRASSLLDSGELEVGKEFSNKDSFFGALKQHS